MSVATEPPIRMDLALFTNSDKTVGAIWLASDAITPVPVASAVLTLEFEQDPTTWDPDGNPVPPAAAERHVIDSTDPADPAGYIDGDLFATGAVVVTIPNGIWAGYTHRDGIWDLVALSTDGFRRTLIRGTFTATEGVST